MMREPSPSPARPTWVVVPARDEEDHLGAALAALDTAARLAPAAVHLVVVDDGSTDGTPEIAAERAATWIHGDAHLLPGPAAGSGWARRIGLDHALAAANVSDAASALIATTDADSLVPPQWLATLHQLVDDGHEVIAGDVALGDDANALLAYERELRLARRLESVRMLEPGAPHPHFAGANLAFTAAALQQLTPLPTPQALEDDALLVRCREVGLPVLRTAAAPVTTSPRIDGRATLGLAASLAADARRLGLTTG